MVLLSASACASDFTFGDLLGKGSFGVVHKVERKGAYDREDIATLACGRYTVQPDFPCCAEIETRALLSPLTRAGGGVRDMLADWGNRRTTADKKTLVSTRVVHPPPLRASSSHPPAPAPPRMRPPVSATV
jgi:hypothetical protein